MPGREPPLLLTIAEAATILRISASQAKKLAATGDLPGCLADKVGNQWRVNRAALMAFVNGDTTNGHR